MGLVLVMVCNHQLLTAEKRLHNTYAGVSRAIFAVKLSMSSCCMDVAECSNITLSAN